MPQFFHTYLKVAGTKTFRLAATQLLGTTNEDGYGGNGQNVPDESRRCIIPSHPDWSFVQADLEGAEAVAVALLVGEGQFRDLIRFGIKPHCFLCIHLFPELFYEFFGPGFNYAELTPRALHEHPQGAAAIAKSKKLKREYDLAKRTVHGYNYGMGWRTHQDSVLKGTRGLVVLPAAEAKRQLETPNRLFPEIKAMQQEVERWVRAGEPVYNLFGERALFIGRITSHLVRTVISWRPQSTVGQCTNVAYCNMQDEIEAGALHANLLDPVHDSILGECPDEEVTALVASMRRNMTYTFKSPIDGWTATIGVEVQVGKNWGKWNETENPNGLRVLKAGSSI